MGVSEAGGVWGLASEIVLPANASHPNAGPYIACSASGRCIAVGDYEDTAGNFQAWAASVTDGVWGQASEIVLPANAATKQFAILSDVACLKAGSCFAVGSYEDTSGTRRAMAVSEAGGVWGQASEITAPANATSADSELSRLACPASGSCVAVGRYEESVGSGQAMVTSETGGAWSQASQVGLPANAAGDPDPDLADVACPASGPCVAVGGYYDSSETYPQALVVSEMGGVWGQASEITAPANATYPDAELDRVACPASGSCVAVGRYESNCCSDHAQAMVVNEVGGLWGQASEITPPSAVSTPELEVACRAPASCGAVGNNGTGYALGMSEKDGVWSEASEIMPASAGASDHLYQIACVAAGPCIAVGDEYTQSSGPVPWVATETPGNEEAPTIVTNEASAVTPTSATLNATVNPNGEAVGDCYFEYGTTESYGSSVPCTSLPGSGESPVAVSAAVGGLSEMTPYHFRIVAINASGTSYGSDQIFKVRPTVETQTALSVTATSATLNATVNPNGEAVGDCYFEYGTTESYGSSVPCTSLPGSGESPVNVSALITGLTTSTTYHFRIVAASPGGASYGNDQTFTTPFSAEFGRCVKVSPEEVGKRTVYRGRFTKATCLDVSPTDTGKYEWKPGVVKAGFTTTAAAVKFETPSKTRVTCTSESGGGAITAATAVGNVVFRFTGCESAGHKCTTTGLSEGELESSKLEGTLGFENRTSNEVGLDLYPSGRSGTFMQFSCDGSSIVLTGSLIGSITADKMATTGALRFKASNSIQKPEAFEAGSKDVLLSSLDGAAPEQAGLTLGTTQTYEEAAEIKRGRIGSASEPLLGSCERCRGRGMSRPTVGPRPASSGVSERVHR